MNESTMEVLNALIDQNRGSFRQNSDKLIGDVVGVAQAIDQLKKALKKVEKCIGEHRYEKASEVGYRDVSSEFIFLQRCLGGLNSTALSKVKIIQDICLVLAENGVDLPYEKVDELVAQHVDYPLSDKSPEHVETRLGNRSFQKLEILSKKTDTPIEHLVEFIVSHAIKNNEPSFQELMEREESERLPEKTYYTTEEVKESIDASMLKAQEAKDNLF